MRIVNSRSVSGKKILIACAATMTAVISVRTAPAQTTNWTGLAGNVWTRGGSWSTLDQPQAGSIALISGGSGTTIALRESDSPGGVHCGTLIITSPLYSTIIAGASAASLNFGTHGSIQYNPSLPSDAFDFGGDNVRTNIGESLRFEGTHRINYESPIFGVGSVVLDGAAVEFAAQSEFSGGVFVSSGTVWLGADSKSDGDAVLSGPVGTGTLSLLANAAYLANGSPNTRTLANPVVATGSPAPLNLVDLFAGGIVMEGPVSGRNSSGSLSSIKIACLGLVKLNNSVNASNWSVASGDGFVELNADNRGALTGAGTLLSGVLHVRANGALGDTGTLNGTRVANGATIRFLGVTYDAAEPLSIAGAGAYDFLQSASLGALNGALNTNSRFGGTVELVSSATIRVESSGTLTVAAPVSGADSSVLSKTGDGLLEVLRFRTGGLAIEQGAVRVADSSGGAGTLQK